VLLPRPLVLLGLEEVEVLADAATSGRGDDDLIDKAALGSDQGVQELVLVPLGIGLDVLATEDNLNGALSSHNGNLTSGPGVVGVSLEVLGGHHIVSSSEGLAGDDGDLRDGSLGVSVEQLGSVGNDTVVLLVSSGKKSGNVDEGDKGNVKRVAEADKASSLDGSVDVQASSLVQRLVGDDTAGAALHADESAENVLGKVRSNLEELIVIGNLLHHQAHVVGLVGVAGDDHVKSRVSASANILGVTDRREGVLVRQRQVVKQLTSHSQSLNIVIIRERRDSTLGGVGLGSSEHLLSHLLTSDSLDDIGTSHEHVRGVANHHNEVSQRGGVNSSSSAGSHDQADLRNNSTGINIALEHLGVSGKGGNSFLDTSTTGIVQSDDRSSSQHGLVHDLANLLSVSLRERSTEHSEVLGEDEHGTTVDLSVASDDTIARVLLVLHAEFGAPVGLEHINYQIPDLQLSVLPTKKNALIDGRTCVSKPADRPRYTSQQFR